MARRKPGCAPNAIWLQIQRPKQAFDEVRNSWWWLDESLTLAQPDKGIAWQWELLRRSKSYRAFHLRADRIRPASSDPNFLQSSACLAELRALADSFGLHGEIKPHQNWTHLFACGCAPHLCWAVLPAHAQNCLRFHAPLYHRADTAGNFGINLTAAPVVATRDSNGVEKLASPKGAAGGAISGKHPSAGILPKDKTAGAFIVVTFDVRAGEHCGKQLEENNPMLTKAIADLAPHLENAPSLVMPTPVKSVVVPSCALNAAQAWIGVTSQIHGNKVCWRFRTLVRSRARREWLPKCLKAWSTPETFLFGGRKITTAYPAFSEFPSSLKTRPARLREQSQIELEAGLCAYDARDIEPRFTPQGLLIPLLKQFPPFGRIAGDPELLRDALKQVSRQISFIDEFYPPSR